MNNTLFSEMVIAHNILCLMGFRSIFEYPNLKYHRGTSDILNGFSVLRCKNNSGQFSTLVAQTFPASQIWLSKWKTFDCEC